MPKVALRVNGQCMVPVVPDGAMIVVDTDRPPVLNGVEIAVVKLGSRQYLCRPLALFDQLIMLHDNPVHANLVVPRTSARVTGPVVSVLERDVA